MMDMVSDLTAEQEEYKTQLTEQEHDHATEMDMKQCDIRRLELDLEEARDEADKMRQQLQQVQEADATATATAKEKDERIAELEVELEIAKEAEARLGRDYDDLLAHFTDLKEEMREAEEERELAGGDRLVSGLVNVDLSAVHEEEHREELQQLHARVSTLSSRNERLTAENERLGARLEETKADLDAARSEVRALSRDCNDMLVANKELRAEIEELREDSAGVGGAGGAVHGLLGDVSMSAVQQQLVEEEVADLRRQLEASEATVLELNQALDEETRGKERLLAKHENECRKLQDARARAETEAESLHSLVSDLNEEKNGLEERLRASIVNEAAQAGAEAAGHRMQEEPESETVQLRELIEKLKRSLTEQKEQQGESGVVLAGG